MCSYILNCKTIKTSKKQISFILDGISYDIFMYCGNALNDDVAHSYKLFNAWIYFIHAEILHDFA